MLTQSFTSGELLDIIAALEVKEDYSYEVQNDPHLAAYYMQLINRFQRIYDALQHLPGEHRIADLVVPVAEVAQTH